MRWLLAAMVLFAGCEEPIRGHIRYGRVHQPAGSRTIHIDVQRWWREVLSIEPGRWRWKHLGVLAVDVDTWRARFVSGRRFSSSQAEDAAGRVYRSAYIEDPKGHRTGLWVREKNKKERLVLIDKAEIWNLTAAPVAGEPFVFYLRQTNIAPDGTRSGSPGLVRVRVKTGEIKTMPLPPNCFIWDWLAARDARHVYLCGRGRHTRTWHGDFETKKWDAPLDGYYQPLDARGTLIERRDIRVAGVKARLIKNGNAETIDLGRSGRIRAVFGTDWVTIYDGKNYTQVIRSLKDGAERRLPKSPLLGAEVELPVSPRK